MTAEPSILIVGTGAMACLFSAKLAPHLAVVHLGTWQEGVEALNSKGVCLVTQAGTEMTHPVRATMDPRECVGIPYAIVLVKSWQTERAAEQLHKCLPEEGVVLTLQNGMGNLDVLEEYLGAERCGLGITTYGASLVEPGVVREGGEGVVFLSQEERLKEFNDWFSMAGFTVEFTDDLAALVWGKLIINAAINPLTALLEVPNGELLVLESARELMRAAAEEAANVASAVGVHLPYGDPTERVEQVARLTAQNHSSMLQDIRRGAPTEIDAISGAICREGDAQGVNTPIAWCLWQLIRARSYQQAGGA